MIKFYTGSYTQEGAPADNPRGQGIGCFELNEDTGDVELCHYKEQKNPSYLVISKDKKHLYAVEEMFEDLKPRVFSYDIEKNGRLSLINSQMLPGDYACHLAIVQNKLVVANYVSGNALSFSILADGGLGPCHQVIQHVGTGTHRERQEAAHVHMVCPFNTNNMFLVDLGLDKAKAYRLNSLTNYWEAIPEYDIQIESGAGARHMVLDETQTYAFVLSELTAEVFVLKREDHGFRQLQTISSLPEGYKENFGAAAIRLHPTGKFLYTSLRGANTITIFEVNKVHKKLSLVRHQSTEGKTPRDFNMDPSGRWLIVANQDSDSLVVFKVNQKTGMLSKRNKIIVETPVNITWLC